MEKMKTQMVDAVFEHGVFRPLTDAATTLTEGQRVRLTVQAPEASEDVLALAVGVYDGLSDDEIDEIERLTRDRRGFFRGRVSA